jgi:nucleoside-diphosphate-sugar epimerase
MFGSNISMITSLREGMSEMRCLVTGGAGFIGSWLVDTLIDNGHDVVVLDDFSSGHRHNLAYAAESDRFTLFTGSVTDPDACRNACEGVDRIFHLAALTSVHRSIAEPVQTHEINTGGTVTLFIAARDAGVKRIVWASSTAVYGNPASLPVVESLPVAPLSPYAATKAAGEQYARAFSEVYDMHIIGLRYFNVYGPRQDPDSDYAAVIPIFVRKALEGARPVIYGDGSQTRDFVFVRDVVAANMRAAFDAPDSAGGAAYNIGTGTAVSVIDLWRTITASENMSLEPDYAPQRPGEVRDSVADITAAHTAFGFTPATDLRTGLKETMEWYRDNGSIV